MLKLRFNNVSQSHSSSLLHAFHRVLLFSTSSSLSSSNNTNNFSNYLINTLGFSEQQSLSISIKLIQSSHGRIPKKVTNFNSQNNAQSVITFLKQIGLDPSQIRKSVTNNPGILFSDVAKTLKPKFDLLHELGFSGSDLARVISANSSLLRRRLGPAIEALRAVLGSDENVVTVIKRSNYVALPLIANCLIPNVELLKSYGVPVERIRKGIVLRPMAFLQKTESLRDVLVTLEEKWGIPRDMATFFYAVELLKSSKESTVESKFRMFKSFGWSDSDVLGLIRRNAHCLALSEARIRNSLEFLMNELGYGADYVASHPCLLTYSVEKRLLPRHKVLEFLKEKGLLRRDCMLYSAALKSDSKFFEQFIQPFKESVPDLHEFYIGYQPKPHVLPQKQGSVGVDVRN